MDLVKILVKQVLNQHASISQISKKVLEMQVSQGWVQRKATCVGEAVDVTGTKHNHPPDQTSHKAKKLVLQ